MRRALENLVKNALDASPGNGVILITGSGPEEGDSSATIQVRDAGSGIPPSIMPKLFQPFVTTRTEGTGLGLANVKKIVEMHGGEVRVENLPEGGALFTIHVPIKMSAV
jgi:signal transduction histidine kinase